MVVESLTCEIDDKQVPNMPKLSEYNVTTTIIKGHSDSDCDNIMFYELTVRHTVGLNSFDWIASVINNVGGPTIK